MIVLCPQCQAPLNEEDKRWHCQNNHSFDKAKQGYCNLLLVQKKRSKAPGDNAEMVMARKRFLAKGFYQPIAAAVTSMTTGQHPIDKPISILDAGCGEGYYTNEIAKALQASNVQHNITGIDISKFAVKAAASSNKSIKWFVANSSHLPVAPHSCDYVISLFSPIPEQSFYQALANEGQLLIASTGKKHLIELREQLYDEVKSDSLDPCDKLNTHFTLKEQQTIRFQLSLNSQQDIQDLLAMTPHYWRASPIKKEALSKLDKLNLTIDINLSLFKKNHD